MGSFDRLLEIYPEAYHEEERAQTFLWYHLRRYPSRKVAHIKDIQSYFKKAGRQAPSPELIRKAFSDTKRFPKGIEPDTFGFASEFRSWHDDKFGSCFESRSFYEWFAQSMDQLREKRPWVYWLFLLGAIASILGLYVGYLSIR